MLNEIERGQLAISAVQCFTRGEGSLSIFPGLIKRVIQERAWERRMHHGRLIELPNLRALITSKPIAGWGQDPRKIEAVIKHDAQALVLFREAMLQDSGQRNDLDNNITEVSRRTGTSRAYSIARVQKSCDPETVAAVLSGEVSPHAALVRAGIRTNRQVYITRSMSDLAKKLRERLSAEEASQLASELSALVSAPGGRNGAC